MSIAVRRLASRDGGPGESIELPPLSPPAPVEASPDPVWVVKRQGAGGLAWVAVPARNREPEPEQGQSR